MASPPEKTIKDLTGRWSLNKSLSDDSDPVLALQGVSYLLRMGIAYAPLDLIITQYQAPPNEGNSSPTPVTHIDIVQTAAKVSSTSEPRCLDDVWRPRADRVFGNVESRSRWVRLAELADEEEHLRAGWLVEGEGELVYTEARSTKDGVWDEDGWVARQVWGMREKDGQRMHARSVVATKGGKTERITLFYNYNGPLQ